jgi:hypothetical protein
MKHILAYFFIFGIVFIGCDKDEKTLPDCDFDNPIEDLGWLKEVKNSLNNCTCQISIFQAQYAGKTVFYQLMNDPACNSVFGVELWDCNGDIVKEYKRGDQDIFASEVVSGEIIYSCKYSLF